MVKAVFRSTRKNPKQQLVRFAAGDAVMREGDSGETMYVIQSGRVEIFKLMDEGETVLATLEKGDFFGEMAVLEKLPRSASARALEETSVLEIDARQFDKMLRTRPEISVRIMRKFSRRLRETDRLLREATGQPLSSGEGGADTAPGEGAEKIVVAAGGVVFDTVGESEAAAFVLTHQASGTHFDLPREGEATIGRFDRVTGLAPDIDLTGVDGSGTSGFLHARLYVHDGKALLLPELANGSSTSVNSMALETGVKTPLEEGDVLGFGDVELTFRTS